MNISLFQGRFQPPTILHKQIIEDQQEVGDIVVVQIVDGKGTSKNKIDNPFSYEERKNYIEKLEINKNQKIEIIRVPNGYFPDIVQTLFSTYKDIDNIIFFCGTDRISQYERIINDSKLDDEQKQKFSFNEKERTDQDVSQSKLRNQLYEKNFKQQKKYLPRELYSEIEEMQNEYKKRVDEYKQSKKGQQNIKSQVEYKKRINKEQNIQLRKLLL